MAESRKFSGVLEDAITSVIHEWNALASRSGFFVPCSNSLRYVRQKIGAWINGSGRPQYGRKTPLGVGDDYLRIFERAITVLGKMEPKKKVRLEDIFSELSSFQVNNLVPGGIEPPTEMDLQIEDIRQNALPPALPPPLRKKMGRPTVVKLKEAKASVKKRSYPVTDAARLRKEQRVLDDIRMEKNELKDSVLYIYETWNQHVAECGGYLKPTRVPHTITKYGLDGCSPASLPSQIARWVKADDWPGGWHNVWDDLIREMKGNSLFNGKEQLRIADMPAWAPTLEFLFRNRDHLHKDIGLHTFLEGDFAHFHDAGKYIVEGGEPTM